MTTHKTARAPSSPHGTKTWLAVVRAYNLCDAVMSVRLAELGLRIGDHEVLATLTTTPGITQQELAARCFVTKSGVSMLLAQLEAKGWVRREADASDARVKRLTLTAAGEKIAARSLKIQSEVVTAMVVGSSEAELTFVTNVMEAVSARLEALR